MAMPVLPESNSTPFSRNPSQLLTRIAAAGYLISALLHVACYITAGWVFYYFGLSYTDQTFENTAPIAASLADESIEDDAARLEIVTEVSLGETQLDSSSEQVASFLKIAENGWVDSAPSDALRSFSAAEKSDTEGGSGSELMFQMPESGLAITKGSFTAWTEPAQPAPSQNYLIIIQIRLPNDVTRYRLSDLAGQVEGTDNYRQSIPYDKDAPMASGVSTRDGLRLVKTSEIVDVVDNKVQLAIRVPGASRLVRDTIRIRSKRLRESQELILVFGKKD